MVWNWIYPAMSHANETNEQFHNSNAPVRNTEALAHTGHDTKTLKKQINLR